MNLSSSHTAIQDLLKRYFDGLYHADSKALVEVFHPDARYINTVSETYCNLSVSEYFRILDERVPPAANGEQRRDNILSIEIGGQNLAFAKVTMTMMERDYIDFLTLIFDTGRWSIITKVFHYQPTTQGE
ncbi:nuclear transport factor 2 family protein [Nitrincola alkalilacustris]|uniref:nuclear transport factor 2 family protein n=1 Tax=Nitrincola alkalilacustris TaxID=1571224 RepID=UPI00124CFC0E|nr:nuclear transport factor 2 family protein [Nitrincola alkalilacustris]